MARNIDETETQFGRQLKMSEAEVDGDAPALLLLEAVGVYASESANQSGLAVVDVPRGSDYNILHAPASHATTRRRFAGAAGGQTKGRRNTGVPGRHYAGESGC